jgi:hypothetical protein
MISSKCKSHVHEIILLKNMFCYPLKFIMGFSLVWVIKKNIDTQLCMYLKIHHYDMNYLNWTIQKKSLKFI